MDDYHAVVARAAAAETKADERAGTIRWLKGVTAVASIVAVVGVGVGFAGYVKSAAVRPTVAVIDSGSRTVQWIEPDTKQAWNLLRSNEEAFALNVVRCMESWHRARWYWNWAECKEMADPKAWEASLSYRFGDVSRETPDVTKARYPGPADMAEVKFGPFPVKLFSENGGKEARVLFTRIDWIGGVKRELPMVATITYYLPEQVPDEPSPMGKAVNPAQLRMLTYQSEVQR